MAEKLNNENCRIAVDAMGGDFAPYNVVLGAIEAMKEDPSLDLYLIGIKDKITSILKESNLSFDENKIIHADEVIEMSDNPTTSIKYKKNSSIAIGANLVKDKKADAFVSAGNTGAMMAASTLIIGRIKNVGRPTMGAPLPSTGRKMCMLIDVGASVDSKPNHFVENAILGSIYVKEIFGVNNPKIGLLSVGEEDSKGNEVSLKAFELLKNVSSINFIGNVEGRDILGGKADIVLCDGFVGNVILKFAESVLTILRHRIKSYADKGIINKVKALIVKNVLKKSLADFNADAQGGVPLLGIDGISIIGHGSSSIFAIKNMILKAKEMHNKKLIEKFEKALENYAK